MSRMTVLMSRAGLVAQGIARGLQQARPGDRMPTVQELAALHGVGNGTVEAALGILSDAGALAIRARGRLGTFIERIDHPMLWELGGGEAVSIALPLPYSRRYEGLATGLQAAFAEAGVPMTLMFVRGSLHRADAVREGRADLAVMSRFAGMQQHGTRIARDFGDRSYVGAHGLVLARGKSPDDPTLRVAVDPSSADQQAMTEARFGDLPAERRVEVSYNQLGRCFATGIVDATVWNLDEVEAHIATPIDIVEIPAYSAGDTTAAVAIAREGGRADAAAIADALVAPAVLTTAAAVVAGDLIPSY